jgi:(1->4)-alpha-D-glucan 1-alpha-D-glucosylmutase
MTAIRATARLQFHRDFTFDDARAIVPYLARLGISHMYASPVTRARPGSTHGYDVVDHQQVNPELGGETALRALVAELRRHGMGLVIDIVPNHMASSPDNPWWWSVLRDGPGSPQANWFDIEWEPIDRNLHGQVLAPFLGQPYGDALDAGVITLKHDPARGGFYIDASGNAYPLAPRSLDGDTGDAAAAAADTDPAAMIARFDPATQDGRQRLHELLERQHYRLAWWRAAPEEINWRRFFEIQDLVGVRVNDPAVFDAVHDMVLRFYEEGLVDGLRVDHVDGLADPIAYCEHLHAAMQERRTRRPGELAAGEPYLVIEKILADNETLDDRWVVDGTTGYDFMSQVAAVLHDPAGEQPLTGLWEEISGDERPFAAVALEARNLMLLRHFQAERRAATRALHRVAVLDTHTRDWGEAAIERVLWQLLAVFPVYRTYAGVNGREGQDRISFGEALTQAHARLGRDRDGDDSPLLELLGLWLGGEAPGEFPENACAARMEAIRRFQQLTPPLAAKSLEDTSFYRYGRLLSRNEVGAEPAMFSLSVDAFHRRCAARGRQWPRAMLATATHDHKRGEDTRMRLAVLSELPALWAATVRDWMGRFAPVEREPSGAPVPVPQPGDRYMLLQTLVAAWPLDLSVDDDQGLREYGDRVSAWQLKALREAKSSTSWIEPDEQYEAACERYLRQLLSGSEPGMPAFELGRFAMRIAPAGALNGLAQTLLRLTAPGVPDLYQGTEFWDFSLVDPDNRRPVDYAARAAALDAPVDAKTLLTNWPSGAIKQAVVRGALAARREHPEIFERGDYTPLPVLGAREGHVLAFVRCVDDRCIFTVVPRLCAAQLIDGVMAATASEARDQAADADTQEAEVSAWPCVPAGFWTSTSILMPPQFAGVGLRDAITGRECRVGPDGMLPLGEALGDFPVALLLQS